MKINNFFQNARVVFQRKKLQLGMGLGAMLPGNMWVYCEFLSSEGISAGIKMIKGFANAEVIHLMYAMQVMIKCVIFLVSYSNA